MVIYPKESGIALTIVRVHNFRSLANIEVDLGSLTVLIGANNAGKTSFLEALFAAIGAGRKALSADDVRLAPSEATVPKNREIIIDVMLRPIGEEGKFLDAYPAGSFWTNLWGTPGIATDTEAKEFTPIRTTLRWSDIKGEYTMERRFLKEWRDFADWTAATVHNRPLNAAQLEPLALHYVDAKRDLEDDLRRPGSFWRRLTEDLGLSAADIIAMETTLSGINQEIVNKSEILKHLKESLAGLQNVVSADSGAVDIAPVARRLRDLSKGVDVSFGTSGAQSFPLARHGMGTRSLASLLVFRAYASWRNRQAINGGDKVHSMLGLEEPESHLHPQAQRSLFGHIRSMPGQRIVSTHSPYFAGQARLDELRLFIKKNGDTHVARLNTSVLADANDIRKLQETVIDTRGDILFSRAVILFEGQTEEQALPVWAQAYWGSSIHELGFCFVRVNGTDYFPFIWLAKALEIPWHVFGDGEAQPVQALNAALKKAGEKDSSSNPNVVIHKKGLNFESALISQGYMAEIEAALDAMSGSKSYLDTYIKEKHGQKAKKGVVRDYTSAGGRERAAFDALTGAKTSVSKHLGHAVVGHKDPARRFPEAIQSFFEGISTAHGLKKVSE